MKRSLRLVHLPQFAIVRRTLQLLVLWHLVFGIVLVPDVHAAPINFVEYYPLDAGNEWNYSTEDFQTNLTVLSGTTEINGVATKALKQSQGVTSFYTNDANGLRLYRIHIPQEDITVTYDPRIALANSIADVGHTENQQGTLFLATSEGALTLNYTSRATLESLETVTVPAGTFNAVKLKWTTDFEGTIQGENIDETITETIWFVRHVGPVKQVSTEEGLTITSVLTSTNVSPPQTDLPNLGARSISGASTRAVFSGGASSNDGASYDDSFTSFDGIDVQVEITVDPDHVAQVGNIYMVAKYNGDFFYRRMGGKWVIWDGIVDHLETADSPRVLNEVELVSVVRDLNGLPGVFKVFVGYQDTSGEIHYNTAPITFTVSQ